MKNLNTYNNYTEDNFVTNLLNYETSKLNDRKTQLELNTPSPIRAVIYLRVSTEMQAGKDKASLKEQEKQAYELIERQGWHHIDTYRDEGKSGTKAEGRDGYL